MIFNIPFKVINLANKLQISISEGTTVGQKIVRESFSEHVKDGQSNYLHSEVDGKPYLIKTSNNYFLLEGKLKVRYEWEDGDKFKKEHLDDFLADVRAKMNHVGDVEYSESEKSGDNYIEAVYAATENTPGWSESAANIEPNCSKASVEIMQDDTVMLCPMQYNPGWTFEKTDIPVGGSFTSNKVGTDEYIVFGQQCRVGGQVINKHSSKKQTSNSIVIENDSDSFCRLVRIYK